jgi:phosphatidate phosphatase APP1
MKTQKLKLQKPQISKLFKNKKPDSWMIMGDSGKGDPTLYCTTVTSSTHII